MPAVATRWMSGVDVSSGLAAQVANLGGTSDLYRIKAVSNSYSALGKHGLYVVSRVYVSGWTSWFWRLLEGMFPLCFFRGRVINVAWLAEDPSAAEKRRRLTSPRAQESSASLAVYALIQTSSSMIRSERCGWVRHNRERKFQGL